MRLSGNLALIRSEIHFACCMDTAMLSFKFVFRGKLLVLSGDFSCVLSDINNGVTGSEMIVSFEEITFVDCA